MSATPKHGQRAKGGRPDVWCVPCRNWHAQEPCPLPTPAVCDMGPCDAEAVVEFTGIDGRQFRTARACDEHAQHLADYCSKPAATWHEDYAVIAQFDHASREWVSLEDLNALPEVTG